MGFDCGLQYCYILVQGLKIEVYEYSFERLFLKLFFILSVLVKLDYILRRLNRGILMLVLKEIFFVFSRSNYFQFNIIYGKFGGYFNKYNVLVIEIIESGFKI